MTSSDNSCDKCFKKFSDPYKLARHVRSQHDDTGANRATCSVCDKTFSCRDYLRNHMVTHSDPGKRKLPCSQCEKVYMTTTALNRHVREAHERQESDKPFGCDYCDKKFWNTTSRKLHTRTHTGERPYSCPQCCATFVVKFSRDEHVRNVHRETEERILGCPHPGCQKRYRNRQCLREHIRTHAAEAAPGGRPTFDCHMPICGKRFKSKQGLERHIQFAHEGREKGHTCLYCGKKFPLAAALSDHIRCHTGEKPYPCSNCERRFGRDRERRVHELNVHHNEKRYRCQECEVAYKCAKSLRIHMEGHKEGGSNTPGGRKKPRAPKPRLRGAERARAEQKTCPVCGKVVRVLQVHLRTHTGEKPYICPECPARFAHSGGLHGHRKALHEPEVVWTHICSFAGCSRSKGFKSRSHLGEHMETHSTDRTKHSCPICSNTFLTKQGLERHIMVQHEVQELQYNCEFCEKKFGTSTQLVMHIRTHTGEKPYACTICTRRFALLSTLGNHETRFHGNERPYACEQCESRFKTAGNLKFHLETHKGGEERKMFECLECGKKLTTKFGLQSHMVCHAAQGEHELPCPICDKTFARDGDLKRHIKNIHTREK